MAIRYDLNDIMNRIAAMETEALSTTSLAINAVPYWPYQQETLPYLCNRINAMDVDRDTLQAREIVIDRWQIEMMLIIGHFGEGYHGELPSRVYAAYVPTLMDYFEDRRELVTVDNIEYRTSPAFLWRADGGAIITGAPGGLRTINNAGIQGTQHYIGFILEVPLLRNVNA